MDRAVAVIPARGGSKRIPRKNIKSFHGKPLIAYSVECALSSGLFERVIVSTDDEEIAEVARKYGAHTPFVRPPELSDDFTGTGAVVQHALDYLEREGARYDYVCTIYATAPFLQVKYLKEGLDALQASPKAHMAFSVTSMPFPIQRTFRITEEGRCEMFFPEHFSSRSQDLEEAYQDAGQFYWENLHNRSDDIPFGRDSIPIILPRYLVQDIDTPEDWERAEMMYEVIQRQKG
jgi:pseudaminic acid cytidylyltransferase